MIGKKKTILVASMLAEGATDDKMELRYGSSIEEYMTREHAKDVRKKINILRSEFSRIGKEKSSNITIDELTDFFNQGNVRS